SVYVILLASFADRRNSPSSGRPSTSRSIDCVRSPFATAPTARVTSIVGHARSSISVFSAVISAERAPIAGVIRMRSLSRPSLPTIRHTRAISWDRSALRVARSLNTSAMRRSRPTRSFGSRASKLPARNSVKPSSTCRKNSSFEVVGGRTAGIDPEDEGRRGSGTAMGKFGRRNQDSCQRNYLESGPVGETDVLRMGTLVPTLSIPLLGYLLFGYLDHTARGPGQIAK